MSGSNQEASMNYLVTGAGRGIGRGLTRSLLSRGHRVFLLDSNEAELQNTLSLASSWTQPSDKSGSSFTGKVVDLRDRQAIKEVVGDVEQFFSGKLHVLVNNAFATPHVWKDRKGLEDDLSSDDILDQWDDKIAVGLTAPFLLSRLCVPILKGKGQNDASVPGNIINISSTRAKQAEDNHEGYSAAKAGLLGLTQSMAISLGHRHSIRVNAIIPGWINVENENKAADESKAKWEDGLTEQDHSWHPAGRVGKVEDILKALLFLAESDFMTGEEIMVDGGVTRKMYYPE